MLIPSDYRHPDDRIGMLEVKSIGDCLLCDKKHSEDRGFCITRTERKTYGHAHVCADCVKLIGIDNFTSALKICYELGDTVGIKEFIHSAFNNQSRA